MRNEQSGWIELHAVEFTLLWRELGFGDLPEWLGIPPFGRTRAIRDAWQGAASRALANRGLGTVTQPADDLAWLLQAVEQGQHMLELQVDTSITALRGLGATGPHGTAAVARVQTQVRIGPVHPEQLVGTMLGVSQPLGAGSGMSANLPVADFERACAAGVLEGQDGFVDVLQRHGVRREEALTLARALTTRVAGGRLGARGLDRDGHWHRAPATVAWLDTEGGRYAVRSDGEWISLTPADPVRLLTMAQEMSAAVE